MPSVSPPDYLPFLSFSFPWKAEFFCPQDKLAEINDDTQVRRRGFQNGTKFKLLTYDFVIPTEDN